MPATIAPLLAFLDESRWWLFVRPRLFWIGISPIAIAFVACLLCKSETVVRVSGWSLELLGLGATGWGLNETRKHFKLPTLYKLIQRWWEVRPRRRRKHAVVTSSSGLSLGGSRFPAYAWTTINPDAPMEQRFAALVENVERLRRDLNDAQTGLDTLSDRVTDGLQREAIARSSLAEELRTKQKSVSTDGLLISLVGLVWVGIGLTLSTMSREISTVLL